MGDKYWEKKFLSKLGFEPQVSGFMHWQLNQLVHRDTYTNSETNLSPSHSYFNPRLSECNTILQFLLESNPQVNIDI